MITQSLALGGRDALENFRQACSYWRKDYTSKASQGVAVVSTSEKLHPALQRFSRAYHDAKSTTLRRAALDVLHRMNLAHLYGVYLETLQELTGRSLDTGARARDVFAADACDVAKNQMFWACYPKFLGRPRSSATGYDQKFRTMLTHAEKWHTLRETFSWGILALIPQGTNTWYEKLPLVNFPIFSLLIRAINPDVVIMGEMISGRVFSLWRGDAPPEQLLYLEHLKTIDEIPSGTNPLQLLEEVNVGYTIRAPIGRAVTIPVGVDENNTAALGAVLAGPSQGDEYHVPDGFFDGINCV